MQIESSNKSPNHSVLTSKAVPFQYKACVVYTSYRYFYHINYSSEEICSEETKAKVMTLLFPGTH